MVARQSMVVTDTMGAMMKKLEVPADSACKPKEEANMIFKEADINQDGKITLDEFKKVMASHDLT